MRPSRRELLVAASVAVFACAAGCDTLARLGSSQPPSSHANLSVDSDTQVAIVLADMIQTLQRLSAGSPAAQAEIVTSARQAFERSAGGTAQLRYALVQIGRAHV